MRAAWDYPAERRTHQEDEVLRELQSPSKSPGNGSLGLGQGRA